MSDQDTSSKQKKSNWGWFWPTIDSLGSAQSATNYAAGVAIFTSTVSLLLIVYNTATGSNLFQIDLWALIDVFIMFGCAAALYWYKSRLAAIVALIVFVAGQVLIRIENPKMAGATGGIIIAIFLVAGLINGVRGTFAFQRMMKLHQDKPLPEGVHVRVPGGAMKVVLIVCATIAVILISFAMVGLMMGES